VSHGGRNSGRVWRQKGGRGSRGGHTGHENKEKSGLQLKSNQVEPQITSIDMDLLKLGKIAATKLFDAIDGIKAHGVEKVSGNLILRDSTNIS
jgi:hypothetical protein